VNRGSSICTHGIGRTGNKSESHILPREAHKDFVVIGGEAAPNDAHTRKIKDLTSVFQWKKHPACLFNASPGI
jgi:hypothetical protein